MRIKLEGDGKWLPSPSIECRLSARRQVIGQVVERCTSAASARAERRGSNRIEQISKGGMGRLRFGFSLGFGDLRFHLLLRHGLNEAEDDFAFARDGHPESLHDAATVLGDTVLIIVWAVVVEDVFFEGAVDDVVHFGEHHLLGLWILQVAGFANFRGTEVGLEDGVDESCGGEGWILRLVVLHDVVPLADEEVDVAVALFFNEFLVAFPRIGIDSVIRAGTAGTIGTTRAGSCGAGEQGGEHGESDRFHSLFGLFFVWVGDTNCLDRVAATVESVVELFFVVCNDHS